MDDLVKDFLVESFEILERVDSDLLALERGDAASDRLASIFRGVHTIKGTCGFLGLERLEGVAHVGENVLSRLRDGELSPSQELISTLLRLLDCLRDIITEIAATGAEPQGDDTRLKEALNAWLKPDAGTKTLVPAATATAEMPALAEPAIAGPAPVAGAPAAPVPVEVAATDPVTDDVLAVVAARGNTEARAVSETTVRLDVALLDRLMNLVGELVLTRNRILQQATALGDPDLTATSQHLDLATTELQRTVMKTRLQPLSVVWNKLPRIMRSVALSCGKQVELVTEGEDTELDKAIIEAIKDPFTHLVRNALDHGIEAPEVRVAAGKPATGTLRLSARQEGGKVTIEVRDDGGGINAEKVKAKAIERGLITENQAAQLSQREALGLVFLPGFSTAAQVNNLSGRGVGMDVVRTHIEKLGGSVDVESVLGEGTVFWLRIPLTLAIVPALTVRCADEVVAVPQSGILEIVRLTGNEANVLDMDDGQVLRLRDRLLPLLPLRKTLGLSDTWPASSVVIVCQSDGRTIGLVIDAVVRTQEIVVKPLGTWISNIGLYAGATILGDGAVALILDIPGLILRAAFKGEEIAEKVEASTATRRDSFIRAMLVQAGNRRLALPLNVVARLEKMNTSTLSWLGTQEVVPYRGSILPLVRVAQASSDARTLNVVVCCLNGNTFGVAVDEVLQVIEADPTVQSYHEDSASGAALIDGQVTEWLDLDKLAASCALRYEDNVSLN